MSEEKAFEVQFNTLSKSPHAFPLMCILFGMYKLHTIDVSQHVPVVRFRTQYESKCLHASRCQGCSPPLVTHPSSRARDRHSTDMYCSKKDGDEMARGTMAAVVQRMAAVVMWWRMSLRRNRNHLISGVVKLALSYDMFLLPDVNR